MIWNAIKEMWIDDNSGSASYDYTIKDEQEFNHPLTITSGEGTKLQFNPQWTISPPPEFLGVVPTIENISERIAFIENELLKAKAMLDMLKRSEQDKVISKRKSPFEK